MMNKYKSQNKYNRIALNKGKGWDRYNQRRDKELKLLRKYIEIERQFMKERYEEDYQYSIERVDKLIKDWNRDNIKYEYTFDSCVLNQESTIKNNQLISSDYAVREKKCKQGNTEVNKKIQSNDDDNNKNEEEDHSDGEFNQYNSNSHSKQEDIKKIDEENEYEDDFNYNESFNVSKHKDNESKQQSIHSSNNKQTQRKESDNKTAKSKDNDKEKSIKHANTLSQSHKSKKQSIQLSHKKDSMKEKIYYQTEYRNTKTKTKAQANSRTINKTKKMAYFERSNNRILMEDFEKQTLSKLNETILTNQAYDYNAFYNILLYSAIKVCLIQRYWRKQYFISILNKQRHYLCCNWANGNKYIVFIFNDKSDDEHNNEIASLFIKVYSIDKIKTVFDTFTLKELKELNIITSEKLLNLNQAQFPSDFFDKIAQLVAIENHLMLTTTSLD